MGSSTYRDPAYPPLRWRIGLAPHQMEGHPPYHLVCQLNDFQTQTISVFMSDLKALRDLLNGHDLNE